MYFRVTLPPSLLSRLAFAVVVGLIANPAWAQTIKGTATYRERMALPPAAVFEATIEDVSRADAPASVVARTRITSPGNPPMMLRRVSGTQTAPGTGTPGTNVKPALDGTSWRATELAGEAGASAK